MTILALRCGHQWRWMGTLVPDTGIDLGADLWRLYRAGRQSLPAVAREFASACINVWNAGDDAQPAFERPAKFAGTTGPVCDEWVELAATVARFLEQTKNNLEDTGIALILAADTYARADDVASHELERLKREHGTR